MSVGLILIELDTDDGGGGVRGGSNYFVLTVDILYQNNYYFKPKLYNYNNRNKI